MSDSRLSKLSKAAELYGTSSFDNYAQIRSVAEKIRDSLCAFLDSEKQCVFLVPPQGPFQAQNYRSMAYSVSGKGFLPLEPISFGLAVNISGEGDYMRLVLTCRKEGEKMFIQIEDSTSFEISLPVSDSALKRFNEKIYLHILHWFTDRVRQYDEGEYGSSDIGFDILRIDQ